MHFSLKQVVENHDLKSWVQNCSSPLQGGPTHKHMFCEVSQSPSAPRFTVVLISKEECERLVPFHFFFNFYFFYSNIALQRLSLSHHFIWLFLASWITLIRSGTQYSTGTRRGIRDYLRKDDISFVSRQLTTSGGSLQQNYYKIAFAFL